MLPAVLVTGIICFALGWVYKDYRWTNAAKNGKIMVVDGDMYKVKRHSETSGGSVEE